MAAELHRYVKRGFEFERMADGGTKITHRAPDGAPLGTLELNLEEWLDLLEHLIHSRDRMSRWKAPMRGGN